MLVIVLPIVVMVLLSSTIVTIWVSSVTVLCSEESVDETFGIQTVEGDTTRVSSDELRSVVDLVVNEESEDEVEVETFLNEFNADSEDVDDDFDVEEIRVAFLDCGCSSDSLDDLTTLEVELDIEESDGRTTDIELLWVVLDVMLNNMEY